LSRHILTELIDGVIPNWFDLFGFLDLARGHWGGDRFRFLTAGALALFIGFSRRSNISRWGRLAGVFVAVQG